MKLLGVALLCSVFASGCANDCKTDDSEVEVRYDGGTHTGNVYETSGWDGPFLHFPPGRKYVLVHGLGSAPADVQIYLAFSSKGLDPDAGTNLAPSAGNQAVIESVTASEIQVRNDSCSDFYLRVVASTPGGDAGTEAGP